MGPSSQNVESRHEGGSLSAAATAALVGYGQSKRDEPRNAEDLHDHNRSFFFHGLAFPCFKSDTVRGKRNKSTPFSKKFRGPALTQSLTVPVEGPAPAAGQILQRPGGA